MGKHKQLKDDKLVFGNNRTTSSQKFEVGAVQKSTNLVEHSFFLFFPRTRLKGNEEKTEAVEKTSDGERTPENATYTETLARGVRILVLAQYTFSRNQKIRKLYAVPASIDSKCSIQSLKTIHSISSM